MPQTIDQVSGTYSASTSSIRGFLQPQSYARRVLLASVSAPAGSTLTVYRGYVPEPSGRVSRVFLASGARTYDSTENDAPISIRAGEAACFEWTGGGVVADAVASATVISQWGKD